MRAHHFSFLFIFLTLSASTTTISGEIIQDWITNSTLIYRRILHQPLYPVTSAPPPDSTDSYLSPPPPPDTPGYNPDQPFFPEDPAGSGSGQTQQTTPPAIAVNGTNPIPTATQPTKPAKIAAIAISVGIVTLGMVSALAFFLYRHRSKKSTETHKLVSGGNTRRFQQEDSRAQPSNFLYIGTVEPGRISTSEISGANGTQSPYHKLSSVKRSDRYRPSPDLQPLPPLANPTPTENSPSPSASSSPASSSSDEESPGTTFYTPQASIASNEDSYYTPISRSAGNNSAIPNRNGSVPHSKRTSPKARISASSPEMKHVIMPSIKQQSTPAPLPPLPPHPPEQRDTHQEFIAPFKRAKFSAPPPPPNTALLQSFNSNSPLRIAKPPIPPPPPPPPPAAGISLPRKTEAVRTGVSLSSLHPKVFRNHESFASSPKNSSENGLRKSMEMVNGKSATASPSSPERTGGDDLDSSNSKPKLKPLHWDKVRATSNRATVWDQLRSSSFQLNEDMMETLFSCNTTNSAPKEPIRRSVLPPVEKENRVLDPKKSQNIAILLKALNVTKEEVYEALLDGNPDGLGPELFETLVKMAPTKEEEIKLQQYIGDVSKLGTAERFLKRILDVPFAFKRVEAMLYQANFDTEVQYLRKSFQTLEVASEELKNSRLFLKLLEAVLRTGNRMNVGTNRGEAKSFKLDTLLKLVDIKGTDGKTTLLHFVVQEIIKSEGTSPYSTNEKLENKITPHIKEDVFKKQGLQVVAGLSRDLSNVKNAAGMDSGVLSSYVSKLEMGLEKVRLVLQYENPDLQGNFYASMKMFLRDADEEIARIKAGEQKALLLVKEATEYFHGDAGKEEAHPFRIFMIVSDFLAVLDRVCKEVGQMQDRTMADSARSFRISASASLPVLTRYKLRQDTSSDKEGLSP